MAFKRAWTITIEFTEDEDNTRADALLKTGMLEFRASGRARRSPTDPEVPLVGEEIAAARAMHDLGGVLLERAAYVIESWERRPVHLDA